MRWIPYLTMLCFAALSGCHAGPPVTEPAGNRVLILYQNPMVVPNRDPAGVWETVADVIDDYFKIEREDPCRLVGNTPTEGRIDTYPEVASTLFEPWRHDSADTYEKIESTLQSIRRVAHVRVIPVSSAEGGYWIDVSVFKELEDVRRPAHATAGAATFRHDLSLTRVTNAVGEQETHAGWIPMGRDAALEQRILGHLQERFGMGVPVHGAGPRVGLREIPGSTE